MAKDRLVTPSYCCILAANFLLYFGFYLLMPVLPFYLTEVFHTGNTMVGHRALLLYGSRPDDPSLFGLSARHARAQAALPDLVFHFYDDFCRLTCRRVADAFHHPADRPTALRSVRSPYRAIPW